MDEQEITFNDLPQLVSKLYSKVELLEKILTSMSKKLNLVKQDKSSNDDHIPMTLEEACEFLRMKKSTMYYHLNKGNIPATHKGKNYILFKDELIKWAESGRTAGKITTPEEENAAILASHRRKPNKFYN